MNTRSPDGVETLMLLIIPLFGLIAIARTVFAGLGFQKTSLLQMSASISLQPEENIWAPLLYKPTLASDPSVRVLLGA